MTNKMTNKPREAIQRFAGNRNEKFERLLRPLTHRPDKTTCLAGGECWSGGQRAQSKVTKGHVYVR